MGKGRRAAAGWLLKGHDLPRLNKLAHDLFVQASGALDELVHKVFGPASTTGDATLATGHRCKKRATRATRKKAVKVLPAPEEEEEVVVEVAPKKRSTRATRKKVEPVSEPVVVE